MANETCEPEETEAEPLNRAERRHQAHVERRLLSYEALRERGIPYSQTHLYRLGKVGKFPLPIQISKRNYWLADEVDAVINKAIARRDAKSAA